MRKFYPRPSRQKNSSRRPNSWLAVWAEQSTLFIKILLNILTFIALISFIVLITKESGHNEIILDAIVVVPEDLVKSGYTGTVVAGRLLDAAREIGFEVEKSSENFTLFTEVTNIGEMKIEAHMPDIQVPGAGFTLQSLFQYTRQVLGFVTYLRGEVTRSENGFILTLRNISDNIPAVQTPVIDDLDKLINEYGGEALLKITKPEILVIQAYHQFEEQISASEPYDESLQKLNEIIDYCLKYPPATDDALALYLRGSALFDQKNYEAAITQYREIIKLDPEYARAHKSWGLALDNLNRPEDAIVQYQKAAEIDPEDTSAYVSLGLTFDNLNRFEDAIVQYQKAIKINPDLPHYYISLGLTLDNLKRYEDAIIQFRKAAEIDPDLSVSYFNWGLTLNNLKRYEDAITKFQKTVEISPGFANAYKNWGLALFNLKRYEDAIAKFQKAVKLDPESSLIYSYWGLALNELKRYEEAIAKFQKTDEINPKFSINHIVWGLTLHNLKRYKDAIAQFQIAVEINPEYAYTYHNWGLALIRLGRYKEAEAKFQKARELEQAQSDNNDPSN